MNKEEILHKLTELVGDMLDHDELVLTEQTTADEVEGWDSLAHVRIVVAAEQAFRVRFSTTEITSLNTVGDLVLLVERHLLGVG